MLHVEFEKKKKQETFCKHACKLIYDTIRHKRTQCTESTHRNSDPNEWTHRVRIAFETKKIPKQCGFSIFYGNGRKHASQHAYDEKQVLPANKLPVTQLWRRRLRGRRQSVIQFVPDWQHYFTMAESFAVSTRDEGRAFVRETTHFAGFFQHQWFDVMPLYMLFE